MSKNIDIEDIFRRNRMAVDGSIICPVNDWNNIIEYIINLEKEVFDISRSTKNQKEIEKCSL